MLYDLKGTRQPFRLSKEDSRLPSCSQCLFLYKLFVGKMTETYLLKQVRLLSVQGGLGSVKTTSILEHFKHFS